ncbi:Uncharacterised protein [Citrobacter braakii]|uniref:DUF6708 domain-containing protein n=1 Tax=Citrobacter braakii TaxID=57706 RepID=UPI000E1269E9|nr:DUF6708 domain-containing protein [Citrobacter braakii]QXA93799.1 hypothetical protein I6L52_04330 [Citrobacter braakii]STB40735.1 Uncharacterised protein [Citrobacter braakii]SUX58176.1 Uncharacterised protein [Citrobacter braakii]
MAISHDIGLFFPFKVNRPLTKEEKQSRFVQGKRRKVFGEAAVLDLDTVIRMNSSYLEVVDKFYPTKGYVASFMMAFCVLFIIAITAIAIITFASGDGIPFFCFFTLAFGCAIYFFGRFLLKDWFRKTHYPVRFNRKKQLVHVYQVSGGIITLPWKDIYFTTSKQRISYCIVGHLLSEDKETVLNTFSFGYVGQREELSLYWEFIRCYMEEDCLEELAETVLFCPPVEKQKEGYIAGLQRLVQIDSRGDWLLLVLNLPFALVESVARYIAMQTSKIPQWSPDVLEACAVEPNDPINVGAENNPPHRWRTVLANETREVFDAKNQHLKSVNQEIKEKLDKKYGTVS